MARYMRCSADVRSALMFGGRGAKGDGTHSFWVEDDVIQAKISVIQDKILHNGMLARRELLGQFLKLGNRRC